VDRPGDHASFAFANAGVPIASAGVRTPVTVAILPIQLPPYEEGFALIERDLFRWDAPRRAR